MSNDIQWSPSMAMRDPKRVEIMALLSESLPRWVKEYSGSIGPGGGCGVKLTNGNTVWYFDTTWGGDDLWTEEGFTGRTHLCVYRTDDTEALAPHDDLTPAGKPDLYDPSLDIAKWIVSVLRRDHA